MTTLQDLFIYSIARDFEMFDIGYTDEKVVNYIHKEKYISKEDVAKTLERYHWIKENLSEFEQKRFEKQLDKVPIIGNYFAAKKTDEAFELMSEALCQIEDIVYGETK